MIYRSHPAAERKGIILLVVLALLTLFAIAGLAFVFYAQSRADSARVYREALLKSIVSGPDTPPDVLFNDWMRQFIFDVGDYKGGANTNFWNSGLRGHSLARTMYGGPVSGDYIDGIGGWAVAPYGGTGRLHTASANLSVSGDDFGLINYTLYTGDTRDPEVMSSGRANFSVPYTYPDMNNMFLAAVRADGTVISPSFHRNWAAFGSLAGANPNWTAAGAAKYQVLRPRPQDNTGVFPLPSDAGGDVKNLLGSPGGNDSIWMDIGSPVKGLPDGTLYKPLYAALVVDLDGRINLNVAGNIRGAGGSQVSNMGLGPWEMNLSSVLFVNPAEWPNILKGTGAANGRYGANGQPDISVANNNVNLTPTGNAAVGTYFYNFHDYDGGDETSGAQSGPLTLPTGVGVAFPTKPSGYGSGSAGELTNHPQLFNIFAPGGDDRTFSAASMKSLLYDGPTGNTAASSTLGKLCPGTLGATGANPGRARHMVTTISWDVDQPGIMPWQADGTGNSFTLTAPAIFPTAGAQPFPAVATVTGGGGAGTEFSAGGQATEVAGAPRLGRIDLNRKLTDYPKPQTDGRFLAADLTTFGQAQTDRQLLAADIYVRLVQVTGAFNQFTNSGTPTPEQVNALRYLAQLAVNMVDYIDVDDYMTPFNWINAAPSGLTTQASFVTAISATTYALDPIGKGWVFGTEIPKLVLNEAYAEIGNDTGDLMGMTKFNLNFYAELYNPFLQDPAQINNAAAMLQMGTGTGSNPAHNNPWAVHQLVITKPNASMRALNNTLGNPDAGNVLLTVADYTADGAASPAVAAGVVGAAGAYGGAGSVVVNAGTTAPYNGTSGSNTVMCIIGPGSQVKNATDNTGPNIPYTIPVKMQTAQMIPTPSPFTDPYTSTQYDSGMSYQISEPTYAGGGPLSRTNPGKYAMLLRRLACPNLPPQTDPAKGNYNPYITVDYVDSPATGNIINAFDGATQDKGAGVTPAVALKDRTSFAKKQPYASETAQWAAETATPAGQPMNTFFSQNSAATALGTFNWLTHLDRPVTSPMELLQVSGFKPHELTQQFINATNTVDAMSPNYQHRAPWTNVGTRLYRVFEFLETKSRVAGTQPGGRLPGKVNINTIWDPEVFMALCDPQSSNAGGPTSTGFTAADVTAVYNTMVAQRSPQLGAAALSGNDMPFVGMAAGYDTGATQYQAGDGRSGTAGGIGMQNTLLAPSGAKFLFEGASATQHPYLRAMLLNKIYNNVTTRSNTFGVWLTVGFFKVQNAPSTSAPPPLLMDEWGLSSGQNIRHHMFAVVDRSTLGVQSAKIGNGSGAISTYGVQTVNLASLPPQIVPGAVIMIDDAPNQESVVVRTVSGNSFTASFGKTHTAGFNIYAITTGNPGPQPKFNATSDSTALVPYYTIID